MTQVIIIISISAAAAWDESGPPGRCSSIISVIDYYSIQRDEKQTKKSDGTLITRGADMTRVFPYIFWRHSVYTNDSDAPRRKSISKDFMLIHGDFKNDQIWRKKRSRWAVRKWRHIFKKRNPLASKTPYATHFFPPRFFRISVCCILSYKVISPTVIY